MLSRIVLLFLLLALSGSQALAGLKPEIKIGILAFQPKSETAKRWQSLGDYLDQVMPDTEFIILPLKHDELELAIAQHDIDFVLTNPFQFTLFHHFYGLSAPLVTIIRGSYEKPLHAFGGTIFTLTERSDIDDLADLNNKKIAVPFRTAFGACQTQQYEMFLSGLPLLREEQYLLTQLPHDNMVHAVLEHKADVGFARAGILERMAVQGKIRLDDFKIINRQPLPDFPYLLSTHLYPEWPLAALPHVSQDDQGRLIANLLNMPNNVRGKLPFGVCGFSPPANYDEVETVLKTLCVPPFDLVPRLLWSDLWRQYRWFILGIGAAFLCILALLLRLSWSKKLLKQSEARWQFALEGSGDGVWDWNPQSDEVFFSSQWKSMLGYDDNDIDNSLAEWNSRVHPDDKEKFYRDLEKHFAGETAVYLSEHRLRCKDGSYKWIMARGKVIPWSAAGEPLRVVGTHTDITLRKQIEEDLRYKTMALEKLTKELESRITEEISKQRKQEAVLIQQAKLASMGEMVGTIAHQWRQPLNTLGLCLQNINDAYAYDELAPDYLERTSRKALDQINLMSRTIDDFRNFFKPDRIKATFDSMQAVGEVLALVSPQLEAHIIRWQMTCITHGKTFTRVAEIIACAEKEIEGYHNEFEHVIMNLLNNAMDAILAKRTLAGPNRPEEGVIDITFSTEESLIVIKIFDNGIGIKPELQEHIFEPYFTTRDQSHGTGLGLYICKVILEEHMHGKLTYEDQESGACFTIKIPGMKKDRHG